MHVKSLNRDDLYPLVSHLKAAKRVFRFLKSAARRRLYFSRHSEGNSKIAGYMDSDWASDSADRKFQGGHKQRINPARRL